MLTSSQTTPLQLFDSNSFHPYERSLVFSEHLLAQAVMVAPIQLLTGNALLAQNVATLLALALSGWAMFFFLREAFGREDAALVGGMLYAFHSYTLFELPRLQVLSMQWWPLAAVYLRRALLSGKAKEGALFGLFFLLQCLSCTYYLFYFSPLLVLWGAAFLAATKGARTLRNVRAVLVPALAVTLLMVAIAVPYLEVSREFGYQRPLAQGVDLLDYLAPPAHTALATWIQIPFRPGVSPHFVGLTALALVAVGLAAAVTRSVPRGGAVFLWMTLVTGVLGVVFASGPTVYVGGVAITSGPYALLYEYVPFLRSLRSPERVSILVYFAVAVFAAYGAAALLSRTGPRLARVLLVVLLVVPTFEHFTGGYYGVEVPSGDDVPEVYRWLAETPEKDPVVELPLYPRERHRFYALYMLFSTYHWRPIVFGRTSFYPPSVDYFAWQLRTFPDPDSVGLLRSQGVKTVVVHPELWEPPDRGERLARLKTFANELRLTSRFPLLVDPQYRRFGLGGETVYRLEGETPPPATSVLCTPRDEIAPDDWTLKGSGEVPESLAIDRNPETAWKTDGQLPDDYLLIDLGREETVAAARLTFGYPYNEFPRHLVLRSRVKGEPFETVRYRDDLSTKLEVLKSLRRRPLDVAITLRFEPRRARRLRMRVGGREYDFSLPDWQLRELFLYKSCEAQSPSRANED